MWLIIVANNNDAESMTSCQDLSFSAVARNMLAGLDSNKAG